MNKIKINKNYLYKILDMDIHKYAVVIYAHYEENIVRKLNDAIHNQDYSCDKFETFDILYKCVDKRLKKFVKSIKY